MPTLFHHLRLPSANPESWVKRSSLAEVFRQIGGTTLGVAGHVMREAAGGVHFTPPVGATAVEPAWQVTLADNGFTLAPGRVRGLKVLGVGSSTLTPEIGGTSLNASPRPRLEYRSDGTIAVELQIKFLRGPAPGNPFSAAAELEAMPEIKWLSTISTALGVIDGTDASHGVFAVPLASVIGGRIHRLRWGDILAFRCGITSFAT